MKKMMIIAATVTATAISTAACYPVNDSADNSQPANEEQKEQKVVQEKQLTDINGKNYTLSENEDGTETAEYEDGQKVTFRRDPETNNLTPISGHSSLLGTLGMLYFLHHGLSGGQGHFDHQQNRYVIDRPMQPIDEKKTNGTASAGRTNGASKTDVSKHAQKNINVPNTKQNIKGAVGNVKNGFGSAGVRSAVS